MPVFNGTPVQSQNAPKVFAGKPADLNQLITQSGMSPQQRQQAGALSESPPLGNALGNRALAGIKRTQQGKLQFLESQYGAGNVVSEGEDFFVKQGDQFFRLDPKGLDFGDVADASGEIISALPATVAGFVTANPVTAAAGGAAGESFRGALSTMIPGDDGLSIGNQLARVGTNAAVSGAAQFGANKLTQGIDSLIPSNAVARTVGKAMKTQTAQNNLKLVDDTGIPLDAAQLTESKQLEGLGGFARMNPFSAGKFAAFDEIVAEKSVQRLTGLLDDLSTKGSQIQAGVGVAKAYRSSVDQVISRRSAQAAKDFGQVRLLSKGESFIDPSNTLSVIREMAENFDVPGGGDASSTLVKRLRRVASEIGEDGMTATQMQRLLEIYGRGARGTGQIFKDIDKGQQKMISGRVFGALQRDLDNAADIGGSEAANALKVARDNYRVNSAPLTELEENVLGRIFGGRIDPAPENVIKKFGSMQPSEIKAAMEVLDGGTAQMVKREYLNTGVDKALSGAQGEFSGRAFNTWFQKNDKALRAMFDPNEFNKVKLTYDVLRKVAKRGGVDGSQTAKWFMVWDAAKNMFTLNPLSLMSTGAKALAPRAIADAMTTQTGRQAIFKVVTAKEPTRAVLKAAGLLTALNAGVVDDVSNQITGQQSQTQPQ